MKLADVFDALLDHFRILPAQLSDAGISLAVFADQLRKALFEKRQEYLIGARFEKQNIRP